MKKYESYIFDLYGTLIDIRTDETGPAFWRGIAALYACRGAKYGPKAIREAYLSLCREEEDALRAAFRDPQADPDGVAAVRLGREAVVRGLVTEDGGENGLTDCHGKPPDD